MTTSTGSPQNQVAAGSVYQTSGGTLTKTGTITPTGKGYSSISNTSNASVYGVIPPMPQIPTGMPLPNEGGNIGSVGQGFAYGYGGGGGFGSAHQTAGFPSRTAFGRYGYNAGVPLTAQQYTPGTTIARWFQPKREFLTT